MERLPLQERPTLPRIPGTRLKPGTLQSLSTICPASTLLFAPSLITAMQVCRIGLVPAALRLLAAITVTRRYLCPGGLLTFGTRRTFSIFPYLSISSSDQQLTEARQFQDSYIGIRAAEFR